MSVSNIDYFLYTYLFGVKTYVGPDASLVELTDSIYAAQMAMTSDARLGKRPHSSSDEDEVFYSDEDEVPCPAHESSLSISGSVMLCI